MDATQHRRRLAIGVAIVFVLLAANRAPGDAGGDPVERALGRADAAFARAGIRHDLRLATFLQSADRPARSWRTLGTFTWQLDGAWDLLETARLGRGGLAWQAYGSAGLGHDTGRTTMAEAVGAISPPNAVTQPGGAILNELYWRQTWAGDRWWVAAGKIDLINHIDTNRVANDGHTQFFAGPLENDPSIPVPPYGGFGAMLHGELRPGLSLGIGTGDSGVRAATAPWHGVDDGSWYEVAEVTTETRLRDLGTGTYRVIGWHNRRRGRRGWGGALSADQELGVPRLVAFLRVGAGEADVTPVRAFVSGGIERWSLPGRPHDAIRLGAAWSEASGRRGGAETLVELQYQLGLRPYLSLAPDVQVIVDPVGARRRDAVVVLGLRLTFVWPPSRPHGAGMARSTTL